ncbi:Alpha/Beta hydrolase protein [Phellopilus nigrolimitatus]|nr:Alpha/Beta hydrolase protein [Phellopilus nigrolimitatus]
MEILRHFNASGSANVLPPSARIDLTLRQRQREPLGFLDTWKYAAFVATKVVELTTDFLSHHIWGPRRKTWTWEMTMISSFMRNAGNHSHLTDLIMLRRLIGIAGYAPLPSNVIITPVTFRVRRRLLRGLLSESDAAETGMRELCGEWVIGKKLRMKLQTDWTSSRKTRHAVGPTTTHKRKDRIILYLHGGAYYMFSSATHRQLTIQLSKYTDTRVFAVDYRLAPEARFPGQLHDAVSAYMRLLEELRIPPENIIVAGDSAGGGLSLSLLMYLRDNKYPLPAGAILMSPWVDLTMSCDSWDTNACYDIVPPPKPGDHLNPISCFLGEDLEKYVMHPYASPLFGDFQGLPPLLIQAGDAEVLRDEIALLAHKAFMAGVHVRYELYEDAVHVFQTFPFSSGSLRAFLACRDFVKIELPLHMKHSTRHLAGDTQAKLECETDKKNSRAIY